jgi:hypothetical protein
VSGIVVAVVLEINEPVDKSLEELKLVRPVAHRINNIQVVQRSHQTQGEVNETIAEEKGRVLFVLVPRRP